MKKRWLWGILTLVLVVLVNLSVQAQSPSPTVSPTPTPTPPSTASPTPVPIPSPPALPQASQASPLPLGQPYRDPGGRFQVGVLQGYSVSPLAGSVLVEAPDGNLSYTVVAQALPPGTPAPLTDVDLAQIAQTVFQRGEGFQPGIAQPTQNGLLINWTGTLTIGGKTQPIGGVILARQTQGRIVLLLIAATQAGADRIPGALASLAGSLQ